MIARNLGLIAASLTLVLDVLPGPLRAQEVRDIAPEATPVPATMGDLRGIIGDWTAKDAAAGFSSPAAGEMVGHLILYNDQGPFMQELWIIRAEAGSVLLRQKHYRANLADLEDKDTWTERRLVAVDPGHVYFNNLTLVTKGATMDMLIRIPGRNGAPPTMLAYSFQRAK